MTKTESTDYKNRSYLSSIESAKFLGISVKMLNNLVESHIIKTQIATSGQRRFDLRELEKHSANFKTNFQTNTEKINIIEINETIQKIFVKNSMKMDDLVDNSIHLMITSPPYFDTKMYSREPIPDDLGNIHDIDEWFEKISAIWKEVYRVLQPGRKAFINIMNLPVRLENGR